MSVALVLSLYLLAAMRLTRLINSDTILDRFRIGIARRAHNTEASSTERRRWSTFNEFLACPWCVGMWISVIGAVAPVALLGWPWWSVIPLGLAASQIIGMAAPLYSEDEIDFEPVTAD